MTHCNIRRPTPADAQAAILAGHSVLCAECGTDEACPKAGAFDAFRAGDAVTIVEGDEPTQIETAEHVAHWVHTSVTPLGDDPKTWIAWRRDGKGQGHVGYIRHTLPADAPAIEAARLARARKAALRGYAEKCAREAVEAAERGHGTMAIVKDRLVAALFCVCDGGTVSLRGELDSGTLAGAALKHGSAVAAELDALLAGVR